jgi:hypothetical protein
LATVPLIRCIREDVDFIGHYFSGAIIIGIVGFLPPRYGRYGRKRGKIFRGNKSGYRCVALPILIKKIAICNNPTKNQVFIIL